MTEPVTRTIRVLRRLRHDRAGVSSLELGIVASLLALAAMQALTALGGEVESDVNTTADAVAEKRSERADPFAKAAKGHALNGDSGSQNSTEEPTEPPVAAADVYTDHPTQPPPVMMAPPVPY